MNILFSRFLPKLSKLCALLIGVLLTGCIEHPRHVTIDVLLPYTPVKDQGSNSTCWAYAMLSTIETEHIVRGDSVHLSVAFIERALEQMAEAPASKRAMSVTALNIIQRFGLVPYDAMPTSDLPMPKKAFFDGVEYSLQEFGRSVCAPEEYVSLCTTDDQPYGQLVELDVPDNWEHNRMLNLPPDSLLNMAERAVSNGHPVCWEGDTSERGFRFAEGYAVTWMFSGSTTDDHCMSIVGLAHDADGQRYFILKNSWGTNNALGGLMVMSFDYYLQKTIAISFSRTAL